MESTLRKLIEDLKQENKLTIIKKEVDPNLEIAELINAIGEKPILFENVKNSNFQVIAGICCSRDMFAKSLGVKKEELLTKLSNAINNLNEPEIIENAPCQEVELEVDLNKLPILKYLEKDGGKYISSAICVIKDPDLGRNVCFHRLMIIGKNKLVGRIIEGRGTDTALKKNKNLEIAICIGNSLPVLLAAATSIEKGKDEFSLANALEKTNIVKCKTIDLEVPAESEIILEGRFTGELADEGPFLDLTETYDKIRKQPVIEILKITHRKNPIFHALLPGKSEHKILMGMPREPTIFNEVNKVCKCMNVIITQGGCSWLHAIVQIDKQNENDGKKAIEAAFLGHASLKHCVVVDKDVNIFDMNEVERAIATRFQADKDLVILEKQPGSSLDPSADFSEAKAKTSKVGIDATIPFHKPRNKFTRVEYEKVNIKDYL